MKTAHEFAHELLVGPDLPIYHFDPSRAGMDNEIDTSVSTPLVQIVKADRRVGVIKPFITIVGKYEIEDELVSVVLADDQLAIDLLMRDPETHETLTLSRKPRSLKNGGFELIVGDKRRKRKWKHVINTEEL